MLLGDYYDEVMDKVAERGNKGSVIGAGVGGLGGLYGGSAALALAARNPKVLSFMMKHPRITLGAASAGAPAGAMTGAALGHKLLDRKKK